MYEIEVSSLQYKTEIPITKVKNEIIFLTMICNPR